MFDAARRQFEFYLRSLVTVSQSTRDARRKVCVSLPLGREHFYDIRDIRNISQESEQ